MSCWDHFEECNECRLERANWEDVAECRREQEVGS